MSDIYAQKRDPRNVFQKAQAAEFKRMFPDSQPYARVADEVFSKVQPRSWQTLQDYSRALHEQADKMGYTKAKAPDVHDIIDKQAVEQFKPQKLRDNVNPAPNPAIQKNADTLSEARFYLGDQDGQRFAALVEKGINNLTPDEQAEYIGLAEKIKGLKSQYQDQPAQASQPARRSLLD